MAILDLATRFRSQAGNYYDSMRGRLDALKGNNGRAGLATGFDPRVYAAPNGAPGGGAAGGAQPGTVRAEEGLKTDEGPKTVSPMSGATEGGLKIPEGPALLTPEQLNKDDYHFNQDFLQYLEAPLDRAERARRTRAAHAVAGVGALGNVLNAFSNLAFATQSAPSQTLPKAPDAGEAVSKERERWDRMARDYANARMQGRSMDLREWQAAQQMENERVRGLNDLEKARYQANVQRYGLEYQQQRDAIKDENDRKRFDLDVEKFGFEKKQADRNYGLQRARLAIESENARTNRELARNRERREQEKHEWLRDSGGLAGARATQGALMNSPSQSYRVNSKLTATEVHNLYNGLPAEVRRGIEEEHPGFKDMSGKERESIEREAIAARIAESDEYAELLHKRGYLRPYRSSARTDGLGWGQGGTDNTETDW